MLVASRDIGLLIRDATIHSSSEVPLIDHIAPVHWNDGQAAQWGYYFHSISLLAFVCELHVACVDMPYKHVDISICHISGRHVAGLTHKAALWGFI